MVNRKTLITIMIILTVLAINVNSAGQKEAATVGKVTITMLDLNPEGSPFIEALNKSFMEQNPGIIIEYEAMSSRQYDQRIQALAAANDLPDIVTTQMFPQYKLMAKNNLFMDLTNTDIVKSGIFDDIAATCLVKDDKVYGLTWNHLAVGAFYDKDIFAKYGLDIPLNWDEFLNACRTLKTNGVTPIVSDLGDGWTCMYIINNAVGNKIYSKNPDYDKDLMSGKVKLNSPEWNDIFEKIKYIYDQGYYGENPMGGKYEQSLSDFANSKGEMHIIGTQTS